LNLPRLGINFRGRVSVSDAVSYAVKAERMGFHSVLVPEYYFMRDSITQSACIAAATEKLRIMTFSNPYTRHPCLTAMTIATLNELSGNRSVLVIGATPVDWLSKMGLQQREPLKAVRESIEIIRAMLSKENVHYDGDVFTIRNATLGFLNGGMNVKVFIAAIGLKLLSLAGVFADGVVLTSAAPQSYLLKALDTVTSSAKKSAKKCEVCAAVLYCPLKEYLDDLRVYIANLISLSVYKPVFENHFNERFRFEITKALADNDGHKLSQLLNEETLSEIAVIGSGSGTEILERYYKMGIDEIILVPVGPINRILEIAYDSFLK
jgi:alkanesulfonate monooxygenase SsuD/methylene tetrahydromethanopterin reductase-like flavin-dependent oxidoreductase (luciferase family)